MNRSRTNEKRKKLPKNISPKHTSTVIQSFSITQSSKPIGTANPSAVNAASWRGDMFFIENIGEGTRNKAQCSMSGVQGKVATNFKLSTLNLTAQTYIRRL
jgi:hypothetical protein